MAEVKREGNTLLVREWFRLTWRRLRKMNCAKGPDFKFITTMSKVIKNSKIYVAGHRGLVGSALIRKLQSEGFTNILCRTHVELDLTRQDSVEAFFKGKCSGGELVIT